MSNKIIRTEHAPSAIGTYSQAVDVGGLVFVSGQIPLDPSTMEVVPGAREQIHRVFKSLGAIANAAGATMNDFVKLTIYLTDLGEFATVNEIMAEYFQEPYPARAAVGVAALPKGVSIEIEGILNLHR